MREVAPSRSSTVLDIGVSNNVGRGTNFFEDLYPWHDALVRGAHGEEGEFEAFREAYPDVRLVLADGRALPFLDNEFDVVFTNAVVEHVGARPQQARFVSECLRVGKAVFLSTPNAVFPVAAHTLLPFAVLAARRS